MDFRCQVGQLLWVGFDGIVAPAQLLRRIAASRVGAVLLFKRNIDSLSQACALNDSLHAAATRDFPILIAVDQEGGRVQRVRAPATEWPPMLRLGEMASASDLRAERATILSENLGRALGLELAALGFDIDFAPVLDVHTNPANPVIGDRAFATTPSLVTRLAGAMARGLQSAGILGCGKHFPGHGDTFLDSHLALPRVDHPEARLHSVELAPFASLPWLPMLMTAHVIFPALDSVPATLSPRILTELLRGHFGYRGLVLSDDLEMKAIADHFGIEEAVERGLLAGCDAFLLCHREDLQLQAEEALIRAAERSPAVRARIEESAKRVLSMKRQFLAGRPTRPDRAVVGCENHRALAMEIAGLSSHPISETPPR
ncbi:MAG: beta-N-acetylhexosaminidase [Deltaproteobacteria bacterium]|nr:beta-N-acetylhexosaminidase [Deltaproteobacteria bacterium]